MKKSQIAIATFMLGAMVSIPFASRAECFQSARQSFKSALHECKSLSGKEKKQCFREAKTQMKASKRACNG